MKLKIIYGSIILVVFSSFFLLQNITYSSNILNIQISEVSEENELISVIVNSSANINTFHAYVYDKNDNLLYEKTSDSSRIVLDDLMVDYNQELKIRVKGSIGESSIISDYYTYINKRISFSLDSDNIIMKDQDVSLKFNGDYEGYHLHLMHNGITIYKEELNDNEINLPFSLFEGFKGRVVSVIENDNHDIVSVNNLYIDPVLVDEIFILVPEDETEMHYNDINLKYIGGDNATSYVANVYKDELLIDSFNGDYNNVIIPAETFSENEDYRIEIVATYMEMVELSKSDSINISILEKEEVLPVTINYDYTDIDKGSLVELSSHTEGSRIFYTTDGSDPLDNGEIYAEPIVVNKDIKLNTIAIKENYNDSVKRIYDIKVGNDQPIIYLSPSNQYKNLGVAEVGYYNEKLITHQITDILEDYLIGNGFKVYRNNPNDNMSIWLNQSRNVSSDLHLAIHTNGSVLHNVQGMEIYVHESMSPALSIARLMYDNLYGIYPYQSDWTDRGVKYAEGALGEVHKDNIDFGILIEIAFHDYYEDALWVIENQKEIAYNIGDSLIEYYQMK